MNVLLISQCSKRAREQTCRILDQFAERTGNGTWQTTITFEGLKTLRKLLRQSARRNTAVACHWLKVCGHSELLWIVGNLRRFNALGRVPTNKTTLDVLRNKSEHGWHSAESIALLAAIAGLFHDFGKAGRKFQETLHDSKKPRFQPYRHEWISVRLFQAFVGNLSDDEWLSKLENIEADDEKALLKCLKKDDAETSDSPFKQLQPLAQVVAWLIVSHHRLPQPLCSASQLPESSGWLTKQFIADWNALNHHNAIWKKQDFTRVWTFPHGTPLQSALWREKARQIAKRAKRTPSLKDFGSLSQLFSMHLARLVLMLADHYYSSQPASPHWQSESYPVWANSDRQSGELKQKLDEHNLAVAHHALLLGRYLPRMRQDLPAIARHKGFRQRAADARFTWQNRAWEVASAVRERSVEHGFFGVNLASTGCGKTFANARIMYALANEDEGCRFSIALGLRTLTLQTGQALQTRLGLDEDDLAILTGSQAVRELHQQVEKPETPERDVGSASADDYFSDHQYVHYEGMVTHGPLQRWLSSDKRLNRLVSAPVLVTTIDHLMPATEGVRGGKQIAPMLRLVTSDLVLDEPDDFDVNDLYAMCRLVNWAGMLGARVLLSSATLPPAQIEALFSAYQAGRMAWSLSCDDAAGSERICCAWFDENSAQAVEVADIDHYRASYFAFIQQRIQVLAKARRLHFARLINPVPASSLANDVVASLTDEISQQMLILHQCHHQIHPSGKSVSLGLVRIANINPLVAIARELISRPLPPDYALHFCVYHSQFPLAVRSRMEKRLDAAFDRHQEAHLWQRPEIAQAIHAHPAKHHLFVVIGTSVIEVGRDWDADWGIIEPSSMRSLIQFAGRIQRHRQQVPQVENIVILNRNIRALRAFEPAYYQPGFETKRWRLFSNEIGELITDGSANTINAIPRISEQVEGNAFAALEHQRLRSALLVSPEPHQPVAAQWWQLPLTWHAVMQSLTPFRHSQPEAQFFLMMDDDDDDDDEEPEFMFRDRQGGMKASAQFEFQNLTCGENIHPWFEIDYRDVMRDLAEERRMEIRDVCLRYGEITLAISKDDAVDDWLYHPWLGVFRALA